MKRKEPGLYLGVGPGAQQVLGERSRGDCGSKAPSAQRFCSASGSLTPVSAISHGTVLRESAYSPCHHAQKGPRLLGFRPLPCAPGPQPPAPLRGAEIS